MNGNTQVSDPLMEIEECFARAYTDFKKRCIDWNLNCLLILRGQELVLLSSPAEDEKEHKLLSRRVYSFEAPLFHNLKAICHLPLALLATFSGRIHVNEVLEELMKLRNHAAAAMNSLRGGHYALTKEQRERSIEMTSRTLDFLTTLLSEEGKSRLTDGELSRFFSSLQPLFTAHIYDATTASLTALDETLRKLIQENDAILKGKRVQIVITGEHMPEEDNMTLQYCLAATKQAKEGDGVFYATSKYSEEEVIDFVAQHLADGVVGARVYGDGEVMHRDVLAPAAEEIVARWIEEGKLPIKQLSKAESKNEQRWKCPFVHK